MKLDRFVNFWAPKWSLGPQVELATDIESLKSRLRATWMAGDYDHFSRYLEKDARSFYESLDVPPGAHLLNVACGSGQLALIAAREGVRVTGVDIAENLIERAQARSMAEGIPACFRVGDAESLPFPDASFDVVVSLIGAIGVEHLSYKPSRRPVGHGDGTAGNTDPCEFSRHQVRTRREHGPVNRAFASLDRAGRMNLHQELEAIWSAHNRGRDAFTLVAAEYLEVIATRV